MKPYLQEERQNGHKRVGAARQQSERSATVHPQRVISRCGNQSERENSDQCLHLLLATCTKKIKIILFQDFESNTVTKILGEIYFKKCRLQEYKQRFISLGKPVHVS